MYNMDDFTDGKSKMSLNQLYTNFEEILMDDPFLPKELSPDWWLGNKALKQMKKLLTKKEKRKKKR